MENLDDNNYEMILKMMITILDRAEDSQVRDIINYYKKRIIGKEVNAYGVDSKRNRDDTMFIKSRL